MHTKTIQNDPYQSRVRKLWERVGLPASQGFILIQEIENDLSLNVVDQTTKDLNICRPLLLKQIGIMPTHFSRRKISGKLASVESKRLVRFIRVVDSAIKLMEGDSQKAIKMACRANFKYEW
jgi:putative toxin-antitoxin system antitoxin component (TIGR02293 family)